MNSQFKAPRKTTTWRESAPLPPVTVDQLHAMVVELQRGHDDLVRKVMDVVADMEDMQDAADTQEASDGEESA